MYEDVKKRFEDDTKEHRMKILLDEGDYRHLHFSKGGPFYAFSLHTWPGQLCISGDMGTYVFSRCKDMFEFFRGDGINPDYWGEKLVSVGTHAGYKEFDAQKFKQRVKEDFAEWSFPTEEEIAIWPEMAKIKEKVWADVEEEVLWHDENENDAMAAACSFCFSEDSYTYEFKDFWEHDLKSFTFHYIWNLFAIVWGIRQYDEAKKMILETKAIAS